MKCNRNFLTIVGLVLGLCAAPTALALAVLLGDAEKGGDVVTARCSGCHVGMFGGDGSEIYTRPNRGVKTIEGLMQRVDICNTNTQNGELNQDQLDDITAFLNETYYLFED